MTTKVYKDALRKLMQEDGMRTIVIRQPGRRNMVDLTLLLTMGHASFSWTEGTGSDVDDDHTASYILAYLIEGALINEPNEIEYFTEAVEPLRRFLGTRIDAYVAAVRLEGRD